MSRAQLIDMAKHNMAHAAAGTIEQEAGIFEVPVHNYFDEDRWQLEMAGADAVVDEEQLSTGSDGP